MIIRYRKWLCAGGEVASRLPIAEFQFIDKSSFFILLLGFIRQAVTKAGIGYIAEVTTSCPTCIMQLCKSGNLSNLFFNLQSGLSAAKINGI